MRRLQVRCLPMRRLQAPRLLPQAALGLVLTVRTWQLEVSRSKPPKTQ